MRRRPVRLPSPPTLVGWLILLVLAAQLWPESPLRVNEHTLVLLALLFCASVFPQLRKGAVRFGGAGLDWEKEVRAVERGLAALEVEAGIAALDALEAELAAMEPVDDEDLARLHRRLRACCAAAHGGGPRTAALLARLVRRFERLLAYSQTWDT